MSDRLLIVDDSPFSRRMINRALPVSWHAIISEANDGETALKMCETLKFDYIFLDLTMPGIDGIEVLRQLKAMEYPAKVYVISADIQQGAQEEAFELGAKAFIPKPVNNESLESFLKKEGVIS